MLFQYELDLNRIQDWLDRHPTLISQRRALAPRGQLLATADAVNAFIGNAFQSAGQRFLARLKQEVWDAKPQWEKDRIEAELAEQPSDMPKVTPIRRAVKPPLTADYLRSIGRADLLDWGSGED